MSAKTDERYVREVIYKKQGILRKSWTYKNAFTKFDIKCKKCKYIWPTCWNYIQSGNWCPKCAGKKITTKEIKSVIQSKGGNVKDSWNYGKCNTKFFVTCKNGHKFETCWNYIKQGQWCTECSKLLGESSVEAETKFKSIVKEKGGVLKKKFIWRGTLYKEHIKCKRCNKTWKTTPKLIGEGKWCPICSLLSKESEEKFRKLIKEKGGKLSNNFIWRGTSHYYQVTCKKGHTWVPKAFNVTSKNTWCPTCSSFKSEKEFRDCIEKATGGLFPKIRPKWLKGLELDGYNKKLRIAFEYQGEQHYNKDHHFHIVTGNKVKSHRTQIRNDRLKKRICKERKVLLIIVPYWIPKEKWKTGIKNKHNKFIARS